MKTKQHIDLSYNNIFNIVSEEHKEYGDAMSKEWFDSVYNSIIKDAGDGFYEPSGKLMDTAREKLYSHDFYNEDLGYDVGRNNYISNNGYEDGDWQVCEDYELVEFIELDDVLEYFR